MVALNFFKSNWKFILIVLLSLTCFWLFKAKNRLKQDRNRLSDNFEQVTQSNSVLNTSIDELKYINTKMVAKYDSVIKANKIKPKAVKSATIIETSYKDTTEQEIATWPYKKNIEPNKKQPDEKQPDESFIIPIETDNGCWGLKGEILTTDGNSKFKVTERTANNSAQLVVTKRKKFLFWTVKPEKYQAFSDCGEVNFTQINIVK